MWLLPALCAVACRSRGERVLHDSKSEFNHVVVREEASGVRTLQFGNGGVIQSRVDVADPMDLKLEYTRAGMLAWALQPEPKRILIIGLGGGAMPTFLHRALPEVVIDVAELDPEVHEAAKRYFGLPDDERIRVHIGDGRQFVKDAKVKWDLVVLDAYSDTEVPRHLATAEFLAEVKAHLNPNAVVSGNIWTRDHNVLHDAMARAWEETFGSVCIVGIQASANQIFLASNGRDVSAEAIRAAAARLKGWPPVQDYAPAECQRDGWENAEALHDP